jgi:hypothetical protein
LIALLPEWNVGSKKALERLGNAPRVLFGEGQPIGYSVYHVCDRHHSLPIALVIELAITIVNMVIISSNTNRATSIITDSPFIQL